MSELFNNDLVHETPRNACLPPRWNHTDTASTTLSDGVKS